MINDLSSGRRIKGTPPNPLLCTLVLCSPARLEKFALCGKANDSLSEHDNTIGVGDAWAFFFVTIMVDPTPADGAYLRALLLFGTRRSVPCPF